MPVYRIYRAKESQQQQFRWAPHTTGATQVKRKDYEEAGQVEAPSVYAAWTGLQESGSPLRVGDVLALEDGQLRICKYVGFEEAGWMVPEVKPAAQAETPVKELRTGGDGAQE